MLVFQHNFGFAICFSFLLIGFVCTVQTSGPFLITMPRAQETTPIRAGPNRTLPRWSISRRRIHDDQSTRHVLNEEKRLLLANPDLVTCAAPVASLWFGLEKGLESLMRFRNIRKLILPSALQRNLLPVLYQLRSFRNLEDLELRSVDMTLPKWPEMLMSEEDAAMPFCDFSKLKRLVLNDVKVDQSFFIWLAEATNLESLELKDMSYEDELHSLRNLTSLRYLKITGLFRVHLDSRFLGSSKT